jgi:hypothetical protein
MTFETQELPLSAFEQRLLDNLLASYDERDTRAHVGELAPDVVRSPVRTRRTGWLATGAGITAAAVAALVLIASGSTAPPADANTILLAAAAAAEQAPASSGTYWHVRIEAVDGAGGQPAPTESWIQRDGQVWLRSQKTRGEVVKLAQTSPFRLGGPEVTFAQLQTLPTDPDALQAWIAHALQRSDVTTSAGKPGAKMQQQFVLDGLVALVSQLPAPPKVRAAAFRALASYPNVESLGASQGGRGLRFSLGEGRQAKLVVDPATSQVRDTNFYVTNDGAEVSLTHGNATIAAEWTNQLPD